MKVNSLKIVSFFLLILGVLMLTGCISTDAGGAKENKEQEPVETVDGQSNPSNNVAVVGKEDLKIAFIFSNSAAQSDQRAKDGFVTYMEENDLPWDVSYADSRGSGQRLASNIEDAVQRKVDAIVVTMADLRAAKASLANANKGGIPVFAVDSGWTPEIVVDVTSNNYVMSSKVSSFLVDRLGGEGKIVAFKMAEHHGVRKRGETLDVIIKENPGIELIEEHNIDYTNFFADTQKTMEDYLSRYGDEIDAVWAGWDEPAMAAASAIQAAGLSKEDIFVVGIDGHAPAIEEMKQGSPIVATVAQGFELMGAKVGSFVFEMLVEGKPQNEVIKSTTVYIDTPLITDMNVPEDGVAPYLSPDFYSSN